MCQPVAGKLDYIVQSVDPSNVGQVWDVYFVITVPANDLMAHGH